MFTWVPFPLHKNNPAQARFVGRPGEERDEPLEVLRAIRSDRRIEAADLQKYYADGGKRTIPLTDRI